MHRLFAIGDIHGHFAELTGLVDTLVKEAGLDPDSDTVVFLGDYVDGGPATRQVVDQLMAWHERYPHWVFLKGNHEDLMLDALVYNNRTYGDYFLWWNQGGRATAHSYLPPDASDYDRAIMQPAEFIATDHLEWLNTRSLTHEQDGYLFVHAGFRPPYHLDAQREEDMLWIREGFFERRFNFGKPVVFGHTPFAEPQVFHDDRPGHTGEIVAIGIDTMFHDFGKLTAVELDPADRRVDLAFFFSHTSPGDDHAADGPRDV